MFSIQGPTTYPPIFRLFDLRVVSPKTDETKDKRFGGVFWEALPRRWWIPTSWLSEWKQWRPLDLEAQTYRDAGVERCHWLDKRSWWWGVLPLHQWLGIQEHHPPCKRGSGNLGLIENIRGGCECLVGERHLHRSKTSRPMGKSRAVAG